VSDNEVTVSYQVASGADAALEARTIESLATYFSDTFEFHGRRLRTIPRSASEPTFADISADIATDPIAELADRGVVAIGDLQLSERELLAHRPFLWSVVSDCTRRYDAAVAFASSRRLSAIGVVATNRQIAQGCLDDAQSRADAAGIALTVTPVDDEASAEVAVRKLHTGQLPMVVVGLDVPHAEQLVRAATADAFDPDWIAADGALTFDVFGQSLQPAWATAAGVTSYSEASPVNGAIGYAAYKTVESDEPALDVDLLYQRLDLLAIGIQLAGRDLTPATFEAGLRTYSPHLGPYGTWDLTSGYAAVADLRIVAWDATTISRFNGQPGAWVSTDRKRYRVNELSTATA
jgi:hypothetical protein